MTEFPYLPISESEEQEMLKSIGISDINELFYSIPEDLKTTISHIIPKTFSELELEKSLKKLSEKNSGANKSLSFLGAGCYEHFIPSVVRHVASRAEFLTSYTPYQPEASQGNLQVFFEYQSLICRLTNLPVSNASLYDGASALAEAAILACSYQSERKKILVPRTLHPDYLSVLKTYLKNFHIQLEIIPFDNGITSLEALSKSLKDNANNIAAVVVQHPNFFGCLEDVEEISKMTHEAGALLISVFDPISLGVIAPPGDYNADVAVAEGQPLGLDKYFGGDNLGIFACKEEFLKRVPGRLVGITKDQQGRRAFVLTLQTREQHIRREKATSNICSNQALNALKASVYLTSVGPKGLKKISQTCVDAVNYAKKKFAELDGIEIPYNQPCFKEFVIKFNKGSVKALISNLAEASVYPGINLEQFFPEMKNCLLTCITETKTKSDVDLLINLVKTYLEIER